MIRSLGLTLSIRENKAYLLQSPWKRWRLWLDAHGAGDILHSDGMHDPYKVQAYMLYRIPAVYIARTHLSCPSETYPAPVSIKWDVYARCVSYNKLPLLWAGLLQFNKNTVLWTDITWIWSIVFPILSSRFYPSNHTGVSCCTALHLVMI